MREFIVSDMRFRRLKEPHHSLYFLTCADKFFYKGYIILAKVCSHHYVYPLAGNEHILIQSGTYNYFNNPFKTIIRHKKNKIEINGGFIICRTKKMAERLLKDTKAGDLSEILKKAVIRECFFPPSSVIASTNIYSLEKYIANCCEVKFFTLKGRNKRAKK